MGKDKKKISAEELEQKFDDGKEDVIQHFEQDPTSRKVLVDLPLTMLKAIDAEADRLGIARQAVIKVWLDEMIRLRSRETIKPLFTAGNI